MGQLTKRVDRVFKELDIKLHGMSYVFEPRIFTMNSKEAPEVMVRSREAMLSAIMKDLAARSAGSSMEAAIDMSKFMTCLPQCGLMDPFILKILERLRIRNKVEYDPDDFENRAIMSRAKQTRRNAGYRVRRALTGRQLINRFARLSSEDDPIEHLVIFGHGGSQELYLNENFQVGSPNRRQRQAGVRSVSDLERAIQSVRVVFNPTAEIHFFASSSASGIEPGDENPVINLAREMARIIT